MPHRGAAEQRYPPRVLHELLTAHRIELIERCGAKTAKRFAPAATEAVRRTAYPVPRPDDPDAADRADAQAHAKPQGVRSLGRRNIVVGDCARPHAARPRVARHGYTVDRVVHDYGDLCQAITDLAFERNAPITGGRIPHAQPVPGQRDRHAVTSWLPARPAVAAQADLAMNERLGSFAHELRDPSDRDARRGRDQDWQGRR